MYTDPKNSGEFMEVVLHTFKCRVGFGSMHINHPDISGLISDESSASHHNKEARKVLHCLVKPRAKLLLCIGRPASSAKRGRVDEYDALYPFLQLRLRFIAQYTSNC